MTICTPEALFFNTGKMGPNPDAKDEESEQKFNEFVVYDESQVKMRYLVQVKF